MSSERVAAHGSGRLPRRGPLADDVDKRPAPGSAEKLTGTVEHSQTKTSDQSEVAEAGARMNDACQRNGGAAMGDTLDANTQLLRLETISDKHARVRLSAPNCCSSS